MNLEELNEMLKWSSSNGHVEIVKLLESHINKSLTK